jgi:hypothetical protein
MAILSICSMLAYNCHLHEELKRFPIGAVFFLVYFRSDVCDGNLDWTVLGISSESLSVEPQMPQEIHSVSRTYSIAIIQLVVNILLVVTSAVMLGEQFDW